MTQKGIKKTNEEKFYSKTVQGPTEPGMETPCLLWKGKQAQHGYGLFCYWDKELQKSREMIAHRFHYIWKVGPIEPGLLVCHKCDIRNCVALDHLFLGTPKENAQDRENKGRGRHDFTAQNRLSSFEANEIRKFQARTGLSQRKIAAKFMVSPTLVRRIITGKAYQDGECPLVSCDWLQLVDEVETVTTIGTSLTGYLIQC